MTTIVGIFDDAADLEKAVERLSRADFENTVYDQTIVAQEFREVSAARPALAPGSAPEVALGSDAPNLLPKQDRAAIVQAFKDRLERQHHLSSTEIDAYASTFLHDGKFVVVETDSDRAKQAMKILEDAGASKVNRHD
jgi:TRAP-type C4-dicarboxylate transport system substrate-binding protein